MMAALVIIGLIGVQVYWINKTIQVEKQALHRSLTADIEKLALDVEKGSYCYELFAKTYINKGEGIYLVKQDVDSNGEYIPPSRGGRIDTIDMFNFHVYNGDSIIESHNSLELKHFAASLDVTYQFLIEGVTDKKRYEFDKLTANNIAQAFDNTLKIDTVIDPEQLDSEVKTILRRYGLDTAYALGIRKANAADYEFLSSADKPEKKYKVTITVPFFQNRIATPYLFTVGIPAPYAKIVRSMSVMMISSGIIILFLVASFIYFVRVIINERRLSEMKNAFINNITHEFRTPITNINLAIQNWRDTQKSSSFYYDVIEEENRRLEAKVDQVLQLAALTHNGINTQYAPVNIHELIPVAVDSFAMQVQKVGGEIISLLNAVDPMIPADEKELLNMLRNLLDNAIKYKSTSPLHIEIRTSDNEKNVVIEVEDNGIGMTAQTQQHIFERFYRSYTGDRHDVKGFGLGLSYVKHIIDHHHGEIQVKSKADKGSTFTITLPKKMKTS